MARLNGRRYALTHAHELEIIEIRDTMGDTQKEIARAYGVCAPTISRILSAENRAIVLQGPPRIRDTVMFRVLEGPDRQRLVEDCPRSGDASSTDR